LEVIRKICGGWELLDQRIAELSEEQLLAVAIHGDAAVEALTSAGIQSAFVEALWSRNELKRRDNAPDECKAR
jgi:hypothetical protein